MEDKEREEEGRENSDRGKNALRMTEETSTPDNKDAERGRVEGHSFPICRAYKWILRILYLMLLVIRDVLLELANQPEAVLSSSTSAYALPRDGAYSFMATVAVVILAVDLCLSALTLEAHLAIGLESLTSYLPPFLRRKSFHRCTAFLVGSLACLDWCWSFGPGTAH